jgi:hypothetical protein
LLVTLAEFIIPVPVEPNDATLRFNLALALEFVGALKESRMHYAEAVRRRPGHGEARSGPSRVEQALAESDVKDR